MNPAADLVRSHYDASARGDLAGMLAPLSPDIEWTEAAGFPLAGTYIGPDAIVEHVFARLAADWQDFSLTVHEIIDAGSTVVGIGTYTATHPETGRAFTARVAHIWRAADGALVRFEQIADTALVVAAMPRREER